MASLATLWQRWLTRGRENAPTAADTAATPPPVPAPSPVPVPAPAPVRQTELELMALEIEYLRNHQGTYLGDGIVLTHLRDGTPIFVNANDYGPPINYINGGHYEDEILAVLLSFVRDDTVFLDIGANLGFYALQIGHRVKTGGRVLAFEPHPLVFDLMKRSRHLNGLTKIIDLHPYGLSDRDETLEFFYPPHHIGGGGLHPEASEPYETMQLPVKRLDDVVGDDFTCDLVKIDAEGHELFILQGMAKLIARAPALKILFENFLEKDDVPKTDVEHLLRSTGMTLYAVGGDAVLRPLAEGALTTFDGYVLAARAEAIGEALDRRRFSAYPAQLRSNSAIRHDRERLIASGEAGHTLFFGPYWLLPRGHWRLRLEGDLGSGIALTLATRGGIAVHEFTLNNQRREARFAAGHDLMQFECVGRALADGCRAEIERIDFFRV
jgi:FkbM family methyltransferase